MNILFLSDVPLENPSSGAEQMLNKQANLLAESKGKSVYAIINERNCVYIDEKFRSGFLKNWHLFLNSPEYPLYDLIKNLKI